MKILLVIFSLVVLKFTAEAQLKVTPVCPDFLVDILDGSINKVDPKSTLGAIKTAFPCYTDVSEDATGSNCNGVFYKDKGVYFYTDRNYFEIRENYKGKFTLPLMGSSRSNLFKTLGNPAIKDINWDAFQMRYGCLVLYYNKSGKINKIQVSTKSTQSLKLCE
ncbi:MAG: hypothetical protein H7258_07980 [Ferruginibacter sp.]|nr:hypothetical protein [Ferruginibacter sp.]